MSNDHHEDAGEMKYDVEFALNELQMVHRALLTECASRQDMATGFDMANRTGKGDAAMQIASGYLALADHIDTEMGEIQKAVDDLA